MPLPHHLAAALLLATAPLALAQNTPPVSTGKPLAFEVVTIEPSHAPGWNMYPTTDGYHGMGISLRQMIKEAYGVWDDKLLTGGPDWIDKDKFDLEARFDPAVVPNAKDLSYRQRADMLRAVLAGRFQLKVNFEKRDFPTFDLVVAKGGPKLTATSNDKVTTTVGGPSCLHRNALFSLEGCTLGALADSLRGPTGRTVMDKTGIAGRYDFELHYTPDNTTADSPLAGGPSIFTAVQEQLGLKLEPSTTTLDILVIDSAQKPSEN